MSNSIQAILAVITILGGGGLLGWWRATRPGRERAEAGWDAILGKPGTNDRAGRQMEPAQPGLIHRVSEVERAVKTLAEIVANQVETDRRVESLESRVTEHDSTLAALIATTFERGADKALTAEQLKNANTVDGEVDR